MPSGLITPIAGRIFFSIAGFIIQSSAQKSPGPQFARTTVRATVLDARHLYGERRSGGQLLFAKVKDGILHMAFALSEGPLGPIQEIYLDGDPLSRIAEDDLEEGQEQPTGGLQVLETGPPRKLAPNRANRFADYVEVWEYFAANGTQGSELHEEFPEDWTTDHVDPGVSWVYVTLRQNEGKRKLFSKIPELSFRTEGKLGTWPGQAVPAPFRHAAAVWWDWLTVVRGIPEDAIPVADVLAAVAVSSPLVPTNPPLPVGYEMYEDESIRYRVDTEINHGMTVAEVQQMLNFAWAGSVLDVGGSILFRPGAANVVGRTITVADILERRESSFDLPLSDKFNAAHAQLEQSKQNDWDEMDMPVLHDRGQQAIQSQVRTLELGVYRGVTWPVVMLRLMVLAMRKIRAGATYRYLLNRGEAFENCLLTPGDRVWIDDPENGLDPTLEGAEPFEVERIIISPDWTVEVELREDPDSLYDDRAQLPPLLPRALQPGLSDDPPPMPVGVTVVDRSHYVTEGGNELAVIQLSWTDQGYRTIFQITDPGLLTRTQVVAYGASVILTSDRAGGHLIEMWHENAYGVRGPGLDPPLAVDTIISTNPVTPVITDVRQRGALLQISIRLGSPSRDIQGADVRYTITDVDDVPNPPLMVLPDPAADPPVAGNWDNPSITTRLTDGAVTPALIEPGLAARTLLVLAGPLLEQGKIRVGLRLVNRAGQLSGLAQSGIYRFTLTDPRLFSETWGGGVPWTGTNVRCGQVPFPGALLLGVDGLPNSVARIGHTLAPDRDYPGALSALKWDGRAGWPVGPAGGTDGEVFWLSSTKNIAGLFGQVVVTGMIARPRYEVHDPGGDTVADRESLRFFAFYGSTSSAMGRVTAANAWAIATGQQSRPSGVNVSEIFPGRRSGDLGSEAEFFKIMMVFRRGHTGVGIARLAVDFEVVI